MGKKWWAGVIGAVILVSVGTVTTAGGATAATLSRAPYVTDLTTSGAYVNWAIEGQQTAGSVMVQPATGGTCPTTIKWTTAAVTSPTRDPLVSGSSTSVSWSVKVGTTTPVTEYQAETPITGLKPATQYCYAVYSSHSSSAQELWPVQTFTTLAPSTSTAPVTFDVLGDTGETQSNTGVEYPNDLNPGEQAIYREIGSSGAQFLLMAGDVSYTGGTETSYGDLNQKGVDTSDIFGPQYLPLAKGIPTYVADGNHGQTNDDLRLWPEPKTVAASKGVYSFGAPPASVDGITNQSPSDWYAIQTGNVRIYVLDAAWADGNTGRAAGALCQPFTSDCQQYQADADEHWQTTSAEYQWLQKDLTAHPGGVKMAVFHYPLASLNNTQPSDPYLSGLESLLSANGVQVAFNGHAHTYQRIVPTAAGSVANFVTGGGGGILEPVDGNGDKSGACAATIAKASVYAIGWNPSATTSPGSACSNSGTLASPTSSMQVFNYLKVTVNGSLVTVTAYNALNQAFDSFQFNYGGTKDTQPPSVPTGLATTSVNSTSVGLKWTASTDNVGVTGYDILRNGTPVGTSPTTSFTDSTVAAGTAYQYTVEAFDAAGNTSLPSAALPVTTPSGSPPPGATFVEHAQSVTKTVTLGSPSTAGDLVTLSASLYTGATNHITAISDTAGDTWHLAADANSSGHNSDGELWWTVTKGGATGITVTTAASNVALDAQEFSGLGATPTVTEVGASNAGTSVSATGTGTGLAIGLVAGHANSEAMTPTSGGFTHQGQVTTPSPVASLVAGYELSGTSPTYGATFSAAMYWAAIVAVFS